MRVRGVSIASSHVAWMDGCLKPDGATHQSNYNRSLRHTDYHHQHYDCRHRYCQASWLRLDIQPQPLAKCHSQASIDYDEAKAKATERIQASQPTETPIEGLLGIKRLALTLAARIQTIDSS